MASLHVLRVFVGPDGRGGNPLGVFLSGGEISEQARQDVARELNFSETVFVDDLETARLRIFTPQVEVPFAGHPTVGTAWLLASEGRAPRTLHTPAGEMTVRYADELTFITARAEWAPDVEFLELDSPREVDALDGAPDGRDTYAWAWLDHDAGLVRARGLFPHAGIPEDEATGSSALELSVALGRPIDVHQGKGSLIHARLLGDGWAEVGGRTELVERRDFMPPRA